MNFLKKLIETIAGLMTIGGFLVLMGVAGASDRADELGQMFNYKDYIPYIVSGFLLLFTGGGLVKWLEKEGWYEEGGED